MIATASKKQPCLHRHRADRNGRQPDVAIDRARCLDCHHNIVRSLITRRWVLSAYLG